MTRNTEQADDPVQDCLERALSRRHLWNEDGNTRAGLFTIMHNIHANDTRKRAARPVLAPAPSSGSTRTWITPSPATSPAEPLLAVSLIVYETFEPTH